MWGPVALILATHNLESGRKHIYMIGRPSDMHFGGGCDFAGGERRVTFYFWPGPVALILATHNLESGKLVKSHYLTD
nr:hypothetical protein [Tanacetum cinerariifolium]